MRVLCRNIAKNWFFRSFRLLITEERYENRKYCKFWAQLLQNTDCFMFFRLWSTTKVIKTKNNANFVQKYCKKLIFSIYSAYYQWRNLLKLEILRILCWYIAKYWIFRSFRLLINEERYKNRKYCKFWAKILQNTGFLCFSARTKAIKTRNIANFQQKHFAKYWMFRAFPLLNKVLHSHVLTLKVQYYKIKMR